MRRHAAIDLALDHASPWMVRNSARRPSARKTNARSHWALARSENLTSTDGRLALVDRLDVTARAGTTPAVMGIVHRLLTGREICGCAHFVRSPR